VHSILGTGKQRYRQGIGEGETDRGEERMDIGKGEQSRQGKGEHRYRQGRGEEGEETDTGG
jgi:hypothetical protein